MTSGRLPGKDKFLPAFARRLRGIYIVKVILDLSTGILKALSVLAALAAVFSLADLVSPMDFSVRKIILVSVVLFAFWKGGYDVFFALREGIKGVCRKIGRQVLTAYELCLYRNKLVSIGISRELIDEEIKEGFIHLKKFSVRKLFRIDVKPVLILVCALAVLILNGTSAGRVVFPRAENISDFMKVEMKKFAIKKEKWDVSVYPVRNLIPNSVGVIPRIFIRFSGGTWTERNLERKGGHFHFEIEECLRPFGVRFKWKDLKTGIHNVRILERPEVASQRLVLSFPEYLKLEKQETTYGGISAFAGTRVEVEIISNEKLKSGEIILIGGGRIKKEKLRVSGKKASGSFKVDEDGSWSVGLVSEEGLESTAPVHWPVEIVEDKKPRVDIVSPQIDLVVSDRFSEVPLRWRASDDFGLTRVFLFFRKNAGAQKKIELYSGYSKVEKGNYLWKISEILNPGDFLEFWVEALDRSGGRGESRHLSVELRDFLLSRREGLNKERAIKEEIFRQYMKQAKLNSGREEITGEELIKKQSEIRDGLAKLSDLNSALLSEMRRDPLYNSFYVSEYEGIRGALDNLVRMSRSAVASFRGKDLQAGFESQNKILQELERLSHLSEEIFKRSTMDNLSNLSAESTDLAEKMDDFLHNTRASEKTEELLQIAKRIEDIMKELAATIKDMPKELPEEFVNSDSIKSLDFNDAASALNDIRKALSSGDIQDAINKAKNLLKSLQKMQEFIRSAAGDVTPLSSGFEKKDETLGEIIDEEEKIYSNTKTVISARDERAKKDAQKRYGILKQKASEIRSVAQKLWQNRSKEFKGDLNRISAMLRYFYKKTQTGMDRFIKGDFDFETPLKNAGKQLEEMKKVSVSSGTVTKIEDVEKQFGNFFEIYNDTGASGISGDESDFLLEVSTRQVKTAEKTDEFAKKLYAYSRRSAQFPREIISDIKNARRQMEKSREFLQALDPDRAAQAQERALYFLKKSAKQMSSSEYVSQAPAGSSSIPMAMPSMQSGSGGGAIGFNEQSFDIPKSKRSFFDELLEELNKAKKTPKPEKYRELLEDYYDQLSK